MPVNNVGAIYATNSKLLQRIYVPHGDDSEIEAQHVHPGETIARVALEVYQTGGAMAVQAAIGRPKISGRCHIIHRATGEILDTIIADPEIYKHPDRHTIKPLD